MSNALEFTRVYVPKVWGSDLWRGLGVPSKAWRVYLNMLLHPLVMYVHIPRNQHGFVPGRGTLTAIKEMLTKTISAKYIYEIDLKACFPSISLPRLKHRMENIHNIPTDISSFYVNFNYALPHIKGIIRNQETQTLSLYRMEQGLRPFGVINYDPYGLRENVRFTNIYARFANELIEEKSLQFTGLEPELVRAFLCSLSDIDKGLKFGIERAIVQWFSDPDYMKLQLTTSRESWLKLIGTVQGSSLSPFLADICLAEMQEVLPQGVTILQYADDAILYGDSTLRDLVESGELYSRFEKIGLVLNEKKSGWVRNFIWMKPLQFLGVKYLNEGNRLVASTRKGATLAFNKHWLLHAEYDIKLLLKTTFGNLLGDWFKYRKLNIAYRKEQRIDEAKIALTLQNFQETLIRIYGLLQNFVDKRLIYDFLALFGQLFRLPIDQSFS